MIYGSLEQSRPHRREYVLANGTKVWTTHMISHPDAERENPNAFLVEQGPGEVGAHFHFTEQYQVAVAGRARFGRHEVRPFVVHYAAAETGYGPIVTGEEGLNYLNLRPVTEHGVNYLPESSGLMTKGVDRLQVTSEPFEVSTGAAMRLRTTQRDETIMAPQEHGAAAWLLRVPPGARLQPPGGPRGYGRGRFYVVLAGALRAEGASLPPLSPVWVAAAEHARPLGLTAGEDGVDTLVVQFSDVEDRPRPATS